MTGDLIPETARANIGRVTSRRVLGEVTRRDIVRFVQAVGDKNPLYRDDDYAEKSRHRGIIAPPLFYLTFVYDPGPDSELWPDGRLRKPGGVEMYGGIEFPELPLKNILAGGRELEFFKPLRIGDVISVSGKLIDIYEKDGKRGKVIFTINENTYFNQKDEIVLIEKLTNIFY